MYNALLSVKNQELNIENLSRQLNNGGKEKTETEANNDLEMEIGKAKTEANNDLEMEIGKAKEHANDALKDYNNLCNNLKTIANTTDIVNETCDKISKNLKDQIHEGKNN